MAATPFERLRETALAGVRAICANEDAKNGGVDPVLLYCMGAEGGEPKVDVLPIPGVLLDGDTAKSFLWKFCAEYLRQNSAIAGAFVSEAWLAGKDDQGRRPVECADRREVVIVAVVDPGSIELWVADMIRDGEQLGLGEWELHSEDIELGGGVPGMLRRGVTPPAAGA